MSNYGVSKFEKGCLRDMLKEGTRDVHGEADKLVTSAILGDKQTSPINVATYRIFLSQLHPVYEALEAGLATNESLPCIGATHFADRLNRLPAIEEDLEYYYGADWRKLVVVLPATERYAQRLRRLATDDGELLMSHAYVRYQGDLSGGQQIKRMLQRLFKLSSAPTDGVDFADDSTAPPGVRFYEFAEISNRAAFKDMYSARVNELDLSDARKSAVVEEAREAFRLSVDLFRDSLEESKRVAAISTQVDTVNEEDKEAVKRMYGKGCPLMGKTPATDNGNDTGNDAAECCNTTDGCPGGRGTCPMVGMMMYATLPILLGVAVVILAPILGSRRYF